MKSTVEKAQPFDRDLTHGTIRILHLEDEPRDAELVESALSTEGLLYQVTEWLPSVISHLHSRKAISI